MLIARLKKPRGGLFIKNAAILTVTSLILRAAGMYFRIYVSGLVGAEGMGLYQLILSVFVLFSGFASSGIVVAVTRLAADELICGTKQSLRAVLRRCVAFSLAMGITSAALAELLAVPIGESWLSDGRSVLPLRIMAMSLPLMSISCCLRGYFTALKKTGIPSVAQIIEQSVRMALAVLLLQEWLPMGVEYACAAIMTADVISEGAGCLYVSVAYFLGRGKQKSASDKPCVKPASLNRAIWGITAPVTASHYLTSLLRTVESVLVPDCLFRFELSRTRALELFGLVKGMALPLALFPSTLLTAFSTLLIPEISQAKSLGRGETIDKAVRRAIRITLSLAIPVGGLFLLFAKEIGLLVYNDERLGPVLTVLAPLMPLMYVESVVVGILRGLGEQSCSLRYGVLDSVVRIILIIIAVPQFGLAGFLGVMVVSNLLTPLLHIRRLMKVSQMRFDLERWMLDPLIAAAPAILCGYLLARLPAALTAPPIVRIGAVGCVVVAIYAALLWLIERGRRVGIKDIGTQGNKALPF